MLNVYKKNLFIMVLCFGIGACKLANNAPAILSTQTPSPISTPTRIPPTPTFSPTATFTPYPTLSGYKPYLLIQQSERVFFEYDANGFGRKTINLPSDGYIPRVNSSLKRIVSPDGKWLAFYTGNFRDSGVQENFPITLKLLNIGDGKVIRVADVVANDYGTKLDQLAENLKILDPERYQPIDNQDWIRRGVQSGFSWSIQSLSWSPDSHILAFAAQIDGLSSDVYIYNLETDSIQRVENSIQNVFDIDWSPDGQYIVFRDSEPGPVYMGLSLYAVKPDDQVIDNPKQLFSRIWMGVGGWISPNTLLVADGTDTAGNFNLQTLDIRTGQLKLLWGDAVGDYVIDPLNQVIAINTSEFTGPENWGVYFITFSGRQTKVLNGLYWATLFFRGGEKHRFLMQGVSVASVESSFPLSGDVIGLSLDGTPTPFGIGKIAYDKISVSPDNYWLLMYNDANLFLYDTNDNLTKTFPISGIQRVIWRPDSQAIFFSNSKSLYILSIPNGAPRLLDECKRSNCSLDDVVWLP